MVYVWKLFSSLVLVMVIFSLSSMLPVMLQASGVIDQGSFLMPAWTHLLMVFFSFLIMLVHGPGKLTDFGLKSCEAGAFRAPLLWALVGGVFLQLILYLTFPSFLGKPIGPSADYSLAQTVLFVWLLASFAEEFLFRGLIQGILSPLERWQVSLGPISLSIPVIVAALLFGLVHLGLLTMKVDFKYVLVITAGAFFVGLLTGYFREKTGSLWPAVVMHVLFNMTGSAVESVLKYLLR